jgi:cytochrome c
MKDLIKYSMIALAMGTLLQASEGEALFQKKCSMCHITTKPTPEQHSKLVAPPMPGVMFHVKEKFKNKQEAVKFMIDYVLNPSKEKALCPSVKKYGVMPSQKGAVTKEELEKITSYIYDTFPKAGFKHPKGMGMGMGMKNK